MPRKQKQYHYIYKTTNTITNKYYYGMHSTNNLDDGYVGSGKRLWYSINKYGKEKHHCQILEFLPCRKSLKLREAEIITEEIIDDVMCMNLCVGGNGGWDYCNSNSLNMKDKHISHFKGRAQSQIVKDKLSEIQKRKIEDESYREYVTNILLENRTTGHKHTRHSKEKISKGNKGKGVGKNNSQYGTCWIHSLLERTNKKILKEDLNSFLSKGWIKGRKMKFIAKPVQLMS